MRVVENAFRGEVRAERGPLMVPHQGVIVGRGAPVQLPDRRDPRSGGRQMRLVSGSRHGKAPYRGDRMARRDMDITAISMIFQLSSYQRPSTPPITERSPDADHRPITADRPHTS